MDVARCSEDATMRAILTAPIEADAKSVAPHMPER
jgi:hypothetical protein